MCEDASAGTTKNTHHIVRQLGDALNKEPHPFPKGLWVNGTLRSANSGATWGLPRINFQKILYRWDWFGLVRLDVLVVIIHTQLLTIVEPIRMIIKVKVVITRVIRVMGRIIILIVKEVMRIVPIKVYIIQEVISSIKELVVLIILV